MQYNLLLIHTLLISKVRLYVLPWFIFEIDATAASSLKNYFANCELKMN